MISMEKKYKPSLVWWEQECTIITENQNTTYFQNECSTKFSSGQPGGESELRKMDSPIMCPHLYIQRKQNKYLPNWLQILPNYSYYKLKLSHNYLMIQICYVTSTHLHSKNFHLLKPIWYLTLKIFFSAYSEKSFLNKQIS